MERGVKEAQVTELKDKLGRVASIVLADYRGIDVPTVTAMRDEFRKVKCEYKVFKNTLVKLATKGTAMEGLAQYLVGPTAAILSYESPSAPAKLAAKFAKEQEKFKLKGAYFEGTIFDAKGVETLAAMPGREELLATLAGMLLSPAQRLAGQLQGPAQTLATILKQKGDETEAAAA
jgi:large subunit ribosomal protein L10